MRLFNNLFFGALLASIFITSISLPSIAQTADKISSPPDSPEKVSPLEAGQVVPNATIRAVNGADSKFRDLIKNKPTVLIFYRGGWCPYCTLHLGELAKIEPELIQQGFQIIAVSPDRPEKLRENIDEHSYNYTLISDSKMELSKAFGLAFKLDQDIVKMYKDEYGIDLEADAGESHHLLPVPAAYVISSQGKVCYRYFNNDYKTRVKPDELLKEAREC